MEAVYEVEAYQGLFKTDKEASAWLEAKRKLLVDAGLKIVQFSLYEPVDGQFNVNIQATRGEKPKGNPGF
jgi:hypothetical protein